MLSKKSRTAASTTVHKNNQRHELYQNTAQKSSGKLEQLGNLLLTLAGADLAEAQRLSGWPLFERKLRLYYSEAGA